MNCLGDAAHNHTKTISLRGSPAGDGGHVLVIDETSSRVFGIAPQRRLRIGRAEDVEIALRGAAVSRHHAELETRDGRTWIRDCESHNGTLVNGKRIQGDVELARGDVVSVGSASLFVYLPEREEDVWADAETLRRDLERSVSSCRVHDHPLTLAVLARTEQTSVWPPRPALIEEAEIRGRLDDDTVLVAWPEWTFDEARQLVARLAADTGVRAGIAAFPSDGMDARALCNAALGAAQLAGEGELVLARDRRGQLEVGGRAVVVLEPAMTRLFELVGQLAKTSLGVVIHGETGTGKEIVARALHEWSTRRAQPFVTVNCGGLTDTLLNSELFGHERGAFTGADTKHVGVFERAHGGTLFLDEIGELSPQGQASLLRVLEEGVIQRVGGQREVSVDVRVVAATHRALRDDAEAGRFREDLLFRLGVATVDVPPLRQRLSEIPVLLRQFAETTAKEEGLEPCRFDPAASRLLQEYAWPGNVRELKNLVAVLVATHPGEIVRAHQLPERIVAGDAEEVAVAEAPRATDAHAPMPLADEVAQLEAQRMREALVATNGVVSHAAARLGVPRRTFTMKMKRYQIDKEGSS